MIERAHSEAKRDNIHATDDAALCERIGSRVVVVPGSERAMKVTTDADFARAEALSILRE
jgi:2-C-methyl-D-erythritol 4-phosphate cytidylyltransferase